MSQRDRNRRDMPTVAGWVDTLNAAGLGQVRVIFAEDGAHRIGRER